MLIPGACKGPLTISLPPESPLVKLAWRTQGGFIISILISAFMYIRNEATMSFWHDTTFEILVNSVFRKFYSPRRRGGSIFEKNLKKL